MTTRTASCRCGALSVTVTGEPVRVSVCHCLNCVHYEIDGKFDDTFNDLVAIPLGAFDDPFFLRPSFSVWEEPKQDWLAVVGDAIERSR